jgi:hypothetical protein
MSARNGKLPIPIPSVITSPQWLGRFSSDVRKAIVALRDRPVIVTGQPGGAAASIPPRPLTVILGSDPDTIRVVPGLINGTMVTLGGDALDDDPPPELTITTATTIYLKIATTYGSPDTHVATVETTDGGPTIAPTGFTSYRRIAEIAFSGGIATITNVTDGGNYDVASFGSVNIWWRV